MKHFQLFALRIYSSFPGLQCCGVTFSGVWEQPSSTSPIPFAQLWPVSGVWSPAKVQESQGLLFQGETCGISTVAFTWEVIWLIMSIYIHVPNWNLSVTMINTVDLVTVTLLIALLCPCVMIFLVSGFVCVAELWTNSTVGGPRTTTIGPEKYVNKQQI